MNSFFSNQFFLKCTFNANLSNFVNFTLQCKSIKLPVQFTSQMLSIILFCPDPPFIEEAHHLTHQYQDQDPGSAVLRGACHQDQDQGGAVLHQCRLGGGQLL